MNDRAIVGTIIQALAEYLKRDAASITPSHHLRDDLGLDSMAVIELLYQDLAGLTTVASVAAYVQNRLAPPRQTAKPSSSKKTSAKGKKR